MRLKILLLVAVVAAWMPAGAANEAIAVLLDNSASVTGGTGYRTDIRDIMKVAGDNEYLFLPVGEKGEKDGTPVISSHDDDRDQRLASVFGFKDRFTHLDGSLARLEGHDRFAEVAEIVIVSDLSPDFKLFKGSTWCFNRDDIADLIAAHSRLDGWLKTGKRLTIALQGWDHVESTTVAEQDLLEIAGALETRRQEIAAGTVCNSEWAMTRNPATAKEEKAKNQLLVEKMVRSLRLRYPEQVQLYNIETGDQEVFVNLLCGRLRVSDQDQDLCVQPEKKDFVVTVAFDPRLTVGHNDVESVKRALPPEVYAPQRRTIRKDRLQVLTQRPARAEIDRNDYLFVVMPGDSGQPYNRPRLYSFVHRGPGDTEEKELVIADTFNPDHDAMLQWTAAQVTKLLGQYIALDFPVPKPLKRVIVADSKCNPLGPGHKFFIRTTYASDPGQTGPDSKSEDSKTRTPDLDRQIGFRIPRAQDARNDLYLFLDPSNSIHLGRIPADFLNSRRPIGFRIPAGYFKTVTLTIDSDRAVPAAPPDSGKDGVNVLKLAAFLEYPSQLTAVPAAPPPSNCSPTGSPGDGAEATAEPPPVNYRVPQTVRLSLLPGTYRFDLVPESPALRAAVREVTVGQDSPPEELAKVISLQTDPLYADTPEEQSRRWEELGGWFNGTDLINPGVEAAEGSAFVLQALLRYTSNVLAKSNDDKDLKDLWRALHDQMFRSERPTSALQLNRAIQELLMAEQIPIPEERRMLARAMFNMFLDGSDESLEGQTDAIIARRSHYNEWLTRVTDRKNGDGLMSEVLADRLKASDLDRPRANQSSGGD